MGRLPSRFSDYEEETIGWIIEEFEQGQKPDESIYPKALIEEALKRLGRQ
jgi:hypothetical protein